MTPGSYMIREYARHVQDFAAECDGHKARWEKTAKDAWRIETPMGGRVKITYRVYAFDLTGGFTFGLEDSPGLGGAFGVEGLALVLTFSDGDVSRRTLFVTGEGDPAGMISVDGEVFVSIE